LLTVPAKCVWNLSIRIQVVPRNPRPVVRTWIFYCRKIWEFTQWV